MPENKRFEPIHEPDSEELRQLYADAVEWGWLGKSPNEPSVWVKPLAVRPDLLKTAMGFIGSVYGSGELPQTVKSMILMTIAYRSDCDYCAIYHHHALRGMGVPENVIKSCVVDPELAELPPPQRAVVRFALKAAKNAQTLSDEDYDGLRDFGFSDGEIAEVVFVALTALVLDVWADAGALETEHPLAP